MGREVGVQMEVISDVVGGGFLAPFFFLRGLRILIRRFLFIFFIHSLIVYLIKQVKLKGS